MDTYPRDPEWYLESQRITGSPPEFKPASVSYIEIWNYKTDDSYISEGILEPIQIKEWLSKEPHKLTKDTEQLEPINGIRLCIESRDDKQQPWRNTWHWDKENLLDIMSEFRLPSSFLRLDYYSKNCYSAWSRQELSGIGSDLDVGFILGPMPDTEIDLELAFSWNATTKVTGGIIRTTNQPLRRAFLRELKSLRQLTSQPLMLGLATLEAIISIIPSRLYTIRNQVAAVQGQTGHLGSLTGAVKLKDPPKFEEVSREVSRISQILSWYHVTWKSYLHLCDFMEQSASSSEKFEDRDIPGHLTRSPAAIKHPEIFSDLLRADRSRLVHQLDRIDYYKELCRIQNQNVYNLMAQRDMQQNIELAKDSKSIAFASKRDSSAMKSIALLTMIVLPGTFISTLFAIPLFNWDAESWRDVPKSRFWFYWALTVPLTILTVVAWLAWQKIYEGTGHSLEQAARASVPNSNIPNDKTDGALPSTGKLEESEDLGISDGKRIRRRHILHRLLPLHKETAPYSERPQAESSV